MKEITCKFYREFFCKFYRDFYTKIEGDFNLGANQHLRHRVRGGGGYENSDKRGQGGRGVAER